MHTHIHHAPLTRQNATTSHRLGHRDIRKKYMHWGQIWKLALLGTGALVVYYWLAG